jgi:hypothetical protein
LTPHHVILDVFGTATIGASTVPIQLFEARLYPVMAAVLFLWALFRLQGGIDGIRKAEASFFAGLGLMSFALFRFFLTLGFGRAWTWANFWEELTEMIATATVAIFLFIFRKQLGLPIGTSVSPEKAK